MNKNYYVNLDIGGTKISFSVFTSTGKFIGKSRFKTSKAKRKKNAVNIIYGEVEKFIKSKKLKLGNLKGLSVGCPGPFDLKKGVLGKLPNLHSWKGLRLRDELKRKFKVKVLLENDANLAALGEATFGAGKGYKKVLYITFSTGIGGGFVQNGEIYSGTTGDAFEIGHLTMEPGGPRCGCGKYGCLEALSSGTAIERFAAQSAILHKNSMLYKLYKKHTRLSTERVLQAVKENDKNALLIWINALNYLALGISNLIQTVNPDVIIIGGGISKQWSLISKQLRNNLKTYTWPRPLRATKLVKCKLGDRAADMGGLALLTKK